MTARALWLLICVLLAPATIGGGAHLSAQELASSPPTLTAADRAWLKAHPHIRLAPDPEFKPIEFFDQTGTYKGLAADYAHLLEQKLGITFDIVRCRDWNDVVERVKRHEVDLLNAVVKTPQRQLFLRFPRPYLKIPSVIVARKQARDQLTLDMLTGMHVVMVSGYGFVDLIRNKYPELNIELEPDLKTALRKVSFGLADAFVGDLATVSSYIESEGLTNLRLAGEVEPPNVSGFAVRSDWPELCDILEKGMALISEEEKAAIFRKWIHLAAEPGLTMQELERLLVLIVGFIVLVVGGFLLWNRMLKRMVTRRTEDLRKEIVERQRAQEALKESEAHLRTLLMTIPDLVWLKDPQGRYLACNAKIERLFGAKEEEIKGRTDYDFVDRELADFFRRMDKAAIEKGGPCLNEEEVVYADDGHQEILETIKTPMYGGDGRLVGVLGIARDITERKLAEQERARMEDQLRQALKMEAIGTLAGGIAHDFNNILAIIIGYAELARDDAPPDPKFVNDLEKVLEAGNRAKELVKQILAFSRQSKAERIPLQLQSLVKEALKMLRSTMPTTIDIHDEIDSRCGVILADPTQVHQILMNLCVNANHAMEQTGGVLGIQLKCICMADEARPRELDLPPGEYVELLVSDTGSGISPEVMDKIFDPYFTTKEHGKGTGMGLAISHGIVSSYGGGITVESEPGVGTTFHVYFPVVAEAEMVLEQEPEKVPLGKERILFVDDEELLAEMGKEMLERLGYQVTLRRGSLDALATFQNDPQAFDLVITDQTMPGMTGADLARRILQIRPGMPIILCTGYSNLIDEESAKALGIKGFALKPLTRSVLASLIRRVLTGDDSLHGQG